MHTPYQKHLGVFLDAQLTFEEYLKAITCKINENIEPSQKLQSILPRLVLMAIYKAFVRPHLNYDSVI